VCARGDTPRVALAIFGDAWQRGPVNESLSTDPPPAHVRELAEQCTRYVQRATSIALDFTPETLPVLDHYLRQVPRTDEAVRSLVTPAAGAYLGEVVRGRFPCRWHAPEGDYGAWRIEFEEVFLHFNPVALAHEAIMGAEVVDGGAGFGVLDQDLDAVRAGLEALGTIAEEDYFKLAIRYEVLATLVDRLVAQALEGEGGAVLFSAEMYRAALDHDPAGPAS
jgi:hypothetical protein